MQLSVDYRPSLEQIIDRVRLDTEIRLRGYFHSLTHYPNWAARNEIYDKLYDRGQFIRSRVLEYIVTKKLQFWADQIKKDEIIIKVSI